MTANGKDSVADDIRALTEPRFLASFWTLSGSAHPSQCAGVSNLPFEVRAEAAAEAGFSGFGFTDEDLQAVRMHDRWRKYADIRQFLDASGLGYLELEVVLNWFAEGEPRAASDKVRAHLLEAAAEMGAAHIKVLADFAHQVPLSAMVDSFGLLCEQAAAAGTRIVLEPTPLTNLSRPEEGLALIRASGATNAGLMIDAWHMGRAGIVFDDLANIPAEYIGGVELDDADADLHGSLLEDTMDYRRQPGEGALEPARLIAAVHRAGYRRPFGIEVASHEHRALPVREAARLSIAAGRVQCALAARMVSVPAD
ncbi:Sugar phosphate isomerase/epimerase [Sphingobium faniae]|nr:Sugar phosphate isomerase/epimerase [Sphingobium faniae]